MRTRPLLLVPILVAGCVPTSPRSVVTKRDPGFTLAQLQGERVAVWPVAVASVDSDAKEGVTDQYGSEDGFLDAVARTLSARLVRPGGPPSLPSDEVVVRFGASDATRPLLDSRRLLGTGADSRFSGRAPELSTLGSQPALQGIRYAVLFPELGVERLQRVSGDKDHTSTVTWARGRLHFAVVDLGRGAVVWEGDLAASGMLTGGGMKQIEEGLGTALDGAMGTPRPLGPAPGTARCETTADCERGTCISRACR